MKQTLLLMLLIILTVMTACSRQQEMLSDMSGDPDRGEVLFRVGRGSDVPPCSTCHQIGTAGFGLPLGPNLADISTISATRIDGMTIDAYIYESIVNPSKYIVPGFRVTMYSDYGKQLTDQEITDLIAYLLSF